LGFWTRYGAAMTAHQPQPDCLICQKHQGRGPLVGPEVWRDENLVVSHRPVADDETTVLGYLYVETRRHVPYLADLTDREAEAIGRVVRRTASALRTELAPAFVFTMVAGMRIAHFHQHLVVRHAGTPAEYDWTAGDQWPDAPRGTKQDVIALCNRLRPHLDEDTSAAHRRD
jgi:ATP adenylyltransferase